MLTNLTQGHLSLLETCPRKFQQIFLEGLAVPLSPDVQASQQWGSRFHLLMQQRELGLTLPTTLADEEHLRACMAALIDQSPELFRPDPQAFRQSEHRRSLTFNGYSLTVIYDLLIWRPESALIVDWKTYLQMPSRTRLAQDWQTRLYLYVLVETTDLLPEQVAMSYWFVRHRNGETGTFEPQEVRIAYSSRQHGQTHQDLLNLTTALRDYQQRREFPQVGWVGEMCDRCLFAAPCGRLPEAAAAASLPTLAEIEEVPL
jgi:hypothetical protein